jgi:hypothetical protein
MEDLGWKTEDMKNLHICTFTHSHIIYIPKFEIEHSK